MSQPGVDSLQQASSEPIGRPFGDDPPTGLRLLAALRFAQPMEPHHGPGDLIRRGRIEQEPVLPVLDEVIATADRSGHEHRQARRHRLVDHQSPLFVQGRVDERLRQPVVVGQLVDGPVPRQPDSVNVLPMDLGLKQRALLAVAQQHQGPGIGPDGLAVVGVGVQQGGQVLSGDEPVRGQPEGPVRQAHRAAVHGGRVGADGVGGGSEVVVIHHVTAQEYPVGRHCQFNGIVPVWPAADQHAVGQTDDAALDRLRQPASWTVIGLALGDDDGGAVVQAAPSQRLQRLGERPSQHNHRAGLELFERLDRALADLHVGQLRVVRLLEQRPADQAVAPV